MRKTILPIMFYAFCFAFAGCSKNVKAPDNKATLSETNKTTSTQTQNQNTSGHTCGGNNSTSNNGGHY